MDFGSALPRFAPALKPKNTDPYLNHEVDAMQTEAKFTPGPWVLEGNWNPSSQENVGGWISTKNFPLFHLETIVGHKATICANARLIAAAPDLYAALTYALRELRLVVDGSVGGVPNAICALIPEAINKGEAALSRARGE